MEPVGRARLLSARKGERSPDRGKIRVAARKQVRAFNDPKLFLLHPPGDGGVHRRAALACRQWMQAI
jgi:hypothetical protein